MARLSPDLHSAGTAADKGMGARRRGMPRLIWALPLIAAAIIAAGALYQFAGPPAAARHVYVASQQLRVVVPVAGAASSYEVYLAQQAEDAGARALVSRELLQSGQLDAAITQEYATEREHAPEAGAALAARAGVPATVRASDVAAALSATHTGNLVTLYARWHTPEGAQALLAAAVITLTTEGVPNSSAPYPVVPAGPTGSVGRPPDAGPAGNPAAGRGSQTSAPMMIQADGAASGAMLDSAVEALALQTLLIRLAFAVAAGVMALLALVVVVRWTGAERGAANV